MTDHDGSADHRQRPRPAKTTPRRPKMNNTDEPRHITITTPLPRLSGIATATTATSATGLLYAFVTGNVQPVYVWPCVTLAGFGMLYDLGHRALDRHHHRRRRRRH